MIATVCGVLLGLWVIRVVGDALFGEEDDDA